MNKNTIELRNVESRMICFARYLSTKQVLEIEFNNGEIYWYKGVPLDIMVGLIQSSSKGKFFLDNIKDNFDYEKLENK